MLFSGIFAFLTFPVPQRIYYGIYSEGIDMIYWIWGLRIIFPPMGDGTLQFGPVYPFYFLELVSFIMSMIVAFVMILIALFMKIKHRIAKGFNLIAIVLGILVVIPETILFLLLGNYAFYFVINVGSFFPYISGILALFSGLAGFVKKKEISSLILKI